MGEARLQLLPAMYNNKPFELRDKDELILLF